MKPDYASYDDFAKGAASVNTSHLPHRPGFRPTPDQENAFRLAVPLDAELATQKIEQAGTKDARQEAMYSVVEQWVGEDLDAAGEWLGAQGVEPDVWPAIRCFVRKAATVDPQSAMIWLNMIEDPKMRAEGFVEIADAWAYANPGQEADISDWSPERQRAWADLTATAMRPPR